jgi:hypothetical protein
LLRLPGQAQVGRGRHIGPAQLRLARPPARIKVHLTGKHNGDAIARDPADIAKHQARQRHFVNTQPIRTVLRARLAAQRMQ